MEVELAQQKANGRPSSRERQKKSALNFDGFCRALVYVARARYLDGHRPESRPVSRGGGSRPNSRNSSRPNSAIRGRPKSREGDPAKKDKKKKGKRKNSLSPSRSRPGSPKRPGSGKKRPGSATKGKLVNEEHYHNPSRKGSISRPGSAVSRTSSVDHGDHLDPTLYRGHTDDEALILRLCDDHIFGGPLPKAGHGIKKKRRKKKKKKKSVLDNDPVRTSANRSIVLKMNLISKGVHQLHSDAGTVFEDALNENERIKLDYLQCDAYYLSHLYHMVHDSTMEDSEIIKIQKWCMESETNDWSMSKICRLQKKKDKEGKEGKEEEDKTKVLVISNDILLHIHELGLKSKEEHVALHPISTWIGDSKWHINEHISEDHGGDDHDDKKDRPETPTSPTSPISRPHTPSSVLAAFSPITEETADSTEPGSPGSPSSPSASPKKSKKKRKKKRHSAVSGLKNLSVSSKFRLEFQQHCDRRAHWAADVIQRAVRGMFGRNLYALAKRAMQNYKRDQRRGIKATILQCRWRKRKARRVMMEKYRTTVVKYIDPVSTRPYWHNPKSNVTVWEKPLCLSEMGEKYDVRRTVELPFPDAEYSNTCDNCSDRVISMWCQQCDENYCKPCSLDLHHHGKKMKHNRFSFDVCVECEYQTASRRCRECTDTYCDTCYWRCHKKGNLKLHTWEPLLELCKYCEDSRTALAVRVGVEGK